VSSHLGTLAPPANMAECVPLALSSSQPKRQIDRFSHFCINHGRKSLCFTMGDPFPQNCPISWRDLQPHLTHDSLSPFKPSTQACQSVQPFDHRVSVYFTIGCPFPPQNWPFPWVSGPPSNTWFPGPTQVLNPNGSSISSAVFAGLTSVTDWPTDHATWSVTIDRRQHLHTQYGQCGLIIIKVS